MLRVQVANTETVVYNISASSWIWALQKVVQGSGFCLLFCKHMTCNGFDVRTALGLVLRRHEVLRAVYVLVGRSIGQALAGAECPSEITLS